MLSSIALHAIREHIADSIVSAQYKSGDTWTDVGSIDVDLQDDGTVCAEFTIGGAAQALNVTGIRLLDADGGVWAERAESMTITSADTGILYRYRIIAEVWENVQ